MRKRLAILLFPLLLCACEADRATKEIADNPGATSRFMGTVDGCRLWSINGGQFYFANCGSGASSAGFRQSSGKTSRYVSVAGDPRP